MGNTYTLSTPLARLVSWWARREDRIAAAETEPAYGMECAADGCGKVVPAGQGIWLPSLRAKACDDDCAHIVQGYNY
jgi:hypothetical protein